MTAPSIVLNGDAAPNRLFASNVMLDQVYYRYLDGEGDGDILYGGYGIVSLTGGTGADRFIVGPTPGSTGTTGYTAITDYNYDQGDRIVLSGGLAQGDVEVRAVTEEDLPFLNNQYDSNRIPAAVGDTVIFDKSTGQAIAVVQNTDPGDIAFVGIDTLALTPEEQALLAPPTGGSFPVQNFNPFAPAFGPRFIELADYADRPAYYLSSGAYTTIAGASDTLNKFVSFDFSDPEAPFGLYLNGRVGPLQHTHTNELELFFVVSGTYIFTEGMQDGVNAGILEDHLVTAGTLAYGPQGRVHGFRALPDDGPGRIFSVALPAGLDKFFENSGTAVQNRYGQIKANSQEEATNTAFWAGQRGDALFLTDWDAGQAFNPFLPDPWATLRPPSTGPSIDGRPIPTFGPQWPGMVTSSIDSQDRPTSVGVFGENRLALVTEDEAQAVTGRVAWKGPFAPSTLPGGSFAYDYITLDAGLNADYEISTTVEEAFHDPQDPTPSSFDLLYALEGPVSVRLYDQIDPNNPFGPSIDLTLDLAALSFLQLPTGTRYSLANTGDQEGQALAIHLFNQIPPAETELSIASIDDTSESDDALLLTGNPTFAAVDFTLESRGKDSTYPLQIAVFSVNELGQILCDCSDHEEEGPHYVSPGDPEYVEEALKHSKVIMSVLDKKAFQALGATSTLTNFSTGQQQFLVVQGSTVADSLAALEDGQDLPANQVRVGDAAVSLSQDGSSVDILFGSNGNQDVVLHAAPRPTSRLEDPLPTGLFNWTYSQQHLGLLDLTYDMNGVTVDQQQNVSYELNVRSLQGQNVDVAVHDFASGSRGKSYRYGFYQVLDEYGTILDPLTGDTITATAENRTEYLAAAKAIAESTATGLLVKGKHGDGYTTKLEGGYLYAPILIPGNGTNSKKALVPFAELNPGGDVYNVMVGTNAWAWEDGKGSKRLFNDLSFGLDVTSPFVQQSQPLMPPV